MKRADASETALRRSAMLMTAFGPVIGAALADDEVIEILGNPDGGLWIERQGTGLAAEAARLRPADVERIIRLVASEANMTCDRDHPIVSAELPSGERFEGLLPPVAPAPCFAIRKPASRTFTLADYVDAGAMTGADALVLKSAIARRHNILIAGGASSGKTTLANALLAEIAKAGDRLVILEDTRELRAEAPDMVALRTAPNVPLERLVRSTLRLRPDRIIIGEVRGGEALDLLKAWNTGHPGGVATVHANSASSALTRLEQLIAERTREIPQELIAEAIDLVVFMKRGATGRRVEDILRVEGLGPEGYRLMKPASPDLVIVKEGTTP